MITNELIFETYFFDTPEDKADIKKVNDIIRRGKVSPDLLDILRIFKTTRENLNSAVQDSMGEDL